MCMIYNPNTYSVWSFFLSENINCFSTYIQSSIHHVQIVMTLMGMIDRYSYKMTGTYFQHLRRKVRNMILSYYAQISKRFDKWEIRCEMETPHSAMRFFLSNWTMSILGFWIPHWYVEMYGRNNRKQIIPLDVIKTLFVFHCFHQTDFLVIMRQWLATQ